MTISKAELIAAVREHAVANYEKDGFDFLVECWTDDDIANAITGAKSKSAAIAAARKAVKVLADARQDARAAGGVDMPKQRKPRTLDDRVIQRPADDFKHIRAVSEGSKRHALVKALEKGATMDELVAALGWSRDVVSSALRYDLGQMGLGCERKAGRYFLLLPKHLARVAVKEKGQAAGEVLLAACKS
jgi:ribosomal protein L12E/L44/L45/RPP1/RPP2